MPHDISNHLEESPRYMLVILALLRSSPLWYHRELTQPMLPEACPYSKPFSPKVWRRAKYKVPVSSVLRNHEPHQEASLHRLMRLPGSKPLQPIGNRGVEEATTSRPNRVDNDRSQNHNMSRTLFPSSMLESSEFAKPGKRAPKVQRVSSIIVAVKEILAPQ